MPTYVTGAQILTFVGRGTGTAEEQEWAGICAGAVQSAFDKKLQGVTITDPSGAFTELSAAARLAGAEAYKRKEASFGITGYADLQNAAIRVAKDYVEGVRPIINRYRLRGPGGGIG